MSAATRRLHRRRLANGLEVLVLPESTVPNLALCTGWRVGSRNEQPGRTGLSHLFEHMMFNGARKYGPKEFDRILESHGGYSNAWTSKDMTAYYEVVPCDALELVLDLELDRFGDLDLSERNFASEREVVKNERRHSVDEYPPAVLDERLHAEAFTEHSYRWPVIGWPEDLDALTLDAVRDYFALHYRPANAVVGGCGAVQPEAALDAVEASLGRLAGGPPQPPVELAEPEQRGERRFRFSREAQLPLVALGLRCPAASSPRLPALEVLQSVLGDGESSRLRQRLVHDEELAVDVGLGFPWALDPTLFVVEGTLREGVEPERFEAALWEELAGAASRPPGERELRKAKNGLAAYHWRQQKTNEGRADLLCRCEILLGDAAALDELPARYEAVTSEEVAVAAAALFREEARTVGILDPVGGES